MKIDPSKLEFWPAHELLVGAALPRPIAWISTIGPDGVHNLAPFSFFTPIVCKPPLVGVSISRRRDGAKKDTVANIEYSRDFVINVVTEELAPAMNQSAKEYPSQVDEFKAVGLTAVPGDRVRSPRVAESPVNLECRLTQILEYGELPRLTSFIIGEILQIHVQDSVRIGETIKFNKLRAVGRMGEDFYCRTLDVFEMKRP